MAWQREFHHMDLEVGEHFIGLVDKSAAGASGEPVRHCLQIRMGEGPFEYKVGSNSVIIKLGGDFTVAHDGTLTDKDGTVFDPRDLEKALIEKLNAHHAKLRAYGKKHNAAELKAKPAPKPGPHNMQVIR